MENESVAEPKRRRKGGKHVRSGCLSCKIRHVKCDEQKPACQKCIDFGITCDENPKNSRKLRFRHHLVPKSGHQGSSSTLPFEDADECRYFALFRDKTVFEISPYFVSNAWPRLLLQACITPAVRNGVVALGALHQASMGRRALLPRDNCTNEAVLHYQYALIQYSKAIKAMKEAIAFGTQDLRTTLITCLVIVFFEAFHGNSTIADNQIQTGVSLIQEWKATHASPRYVVGIASPNPYVIEDELAEAFARLELQTNCRGDGRSASLHEALGRESDGHLKSMPKTFTSIESARTYLEVIMRRQQHLAFVGAHYHLSITEDQQAVAIRIDEEKRQLLQRWECAFENLLHQHPQYRDTIGSMCLGIQLKASRIALLTCAFVRNPSDPAVTMMTAGPERPPNDPSNRLESDMISVIDDSTKVLETLQRNPQTPQFTVDLGVIVPLYLIGLKCRTSSIRKRAIDLLLKYPRREGLWDSILSGKVTDWVRNIEEEYLEGDVVPAWARVRRLDLKYDLLERTANITCRQKLTKNDSEMRERYTVITW